MTGNTMTGRDLILYILQNGLENEPMYKDGHLLGFMNVVEAAIKFDVAESTIRAWMDIGRLHYIRIGTYFFIPAESKDPRDILKGAGHQNGKQISHS